MCKMGIGIIEKIQSREQPQRYKRYSYFNEIYTDVAEMLWNYTT